jgi:hypothetical protein
MASRHPRIVAKHLQRFEALVLSEVIILANWHTLLPQDGIDHAHVEVEVGDGEGVYVAQASEFLLAAACNQDDFLVLNYKASIFVQTQEKKARLTSLKGFRVNTLQDSNGLGDALLELREGLLLVGHGEWLDLANADCKTLGSVANALDLS